MFFVSVASKGLSYTVSLLFATLARRSISVAVKGLKAIRCKYGGSQKSSCDDVNISIWSFARHCAVVLVLFDHRPMQFLLAAEDAMDEMIDQRAEEQKPQDENLRSLNYC